MKTLEKKSRWKWVFENPTNCAATFGGLVSYLAQQLTVVD